LSAWAQVAQRPAALSMLSPWSICQTRSSQCKPAAYALVRVGDRPTANVSSRLLTAEISIAIEAVDAAKGPDQQANVAEPKASRANTHGTHQIHGKTRFSDTKPGLSQHSTEDQTMNSHHPSLLSAFVALFIHRRRRRWDSVGCSPVAQWRLVWRHIRGRHRQRRSGRRASSPPCMLSQGVDADFGAHLTLDSEEPRATARPGADSGDEARPVTRLAAPRACGCFEDSPSPRREA